MFPQKVAVREMNPHLICALCGGYFVDATTIIECLHSFCKSCIVKHLETSKYCPICDVQVHKTRPLENIRPDHILQEIVYKLVPNLYQNEMQCRREFYRKHQESVPTSCEAKGEISDECSIFFPEESILLSLEYNSSNSASMSHQSSCGKRYLRCPAAVTVLHLQKLMRSKFGLTQDCKVDFFYKEELLPGFLSLLDIAYIFQWRRKTPLHLSYQILEKKSQIVKSDPEKTEESTLSENNSDSSELVKAETVPGVTKVIKDNWMEVELQISENGVMSAAASSSSELKAKSTETTPATTKNSELEVKKEESKPEVLPCEKTAEPEKSKSDVKESCIPASKSEAKKEPPSISLTEVKVKSTSEVSVTRSVVNPASNAKNAKKTESVDNRVKAEVSISLSKDSIAKVDEVSKVKANDRVNKPKEALKQDSDECKVRTNEVSVKSESVWKAAQIPGPGPSPDNSKKVCKVEPSLMGLPCGLSIIQRPAVKTYPGLKPINPGKEPIDGLKAIAGLSKEVSIKPIVSISTSAAPLPNKTDVSCSLKIPSSAPPIVPPSKKPTPIRYKTLKSPTKPWNPSIPRSSMLMMKQNNASDPNQPKSTVKPPKFFKMRNVPRFLGAPASGVKPLYQASESGLLGNESQNKLDLSSQKSGNSSVTLMKIDPKTLNPIVVSSNPSLSPNSTVSHPKKSPLPPPYTPGSPKQSPISKSKPVINNKTPAHGTPIPSPAHSSSLLSPNSFYGAANPLMYAGFPHPYSHADSANRLLAGATNSDLMRAMSSLCPPFHPSLSMLFNSQVGFPRLSPPTKSTPKSLSSKQSPPVLSSIPASVSVSSPSPSTYTPPPSKPKKPIAEQIRTRPNLTIENSRYNVYANGFLSSPTERHSPKSATKTESEKKHTHKADNVPKSKPIPKAIPVEKDKEKIQRMEVDIVEPMKKEGKNLSNCDRDLPVSSCKRLKKDDSLESNNNFKEISAISKKQSEIKVSQASKDSCDIKPESSLACRPKEPSVASQPKESSLVSTPTETNTVNQPSESPSVSWSKEPSTVSKSNESVAANKPNEPASVNRLKESSLVNRQNENSSSNPPKESSVVNEPNNSNLVSKPKEVSTDENKVRNENRNEVKESTKKDDSKNKNDEDSSSKGNTNEKVSASTNCIGENTNCVEMKDVSVMQNDSNKKARIDENSKKENSCKSDVSLSVESLKDQTDKVTKSELSLSTVNNNCKTPSDTKKIDSLVCSDAVPQVN